MDQIGYKLRDFMEAILEEMTNQQETLQTKVHDQCSRLQQLLETIQLTTTLGVGTTQQGIPGEA